MTLPNLFQDNSRALTFTIGDTRFGIDVSYILAFSDEYNQIQAATSITPGFVGYLDYRDTLVKVFECATILHLERQRDQQAEFIADIDKYQKAQSEWVDALEHSIASDTPFTKARSTRNSDFTRWYTELDTQDEGLSQLIDKIAEPHQQLYSAADRLLAMKDGGDRERALRMLQLERATTLRKLIRALDFIRDYLKENIHPVVLHLTSDGVTPWFSLVLDQIDDIIDYEPDQVDRSISLSNEEEPLDGYLRHKSGNNYMMLSMDRLYQNLEQIFDKAG